MGRAQRTKGAAAEREVVKILKRYGHKNATRNYADKQDGRGVDVTAGNMSFQVKRYKDNVPMSKWNEIKDYNRIRILASRVDRGEWMATMRLEDLLAIIEDVALAWDPELPSPPPF